MKECDLNSNRIKEFNIEQIHSVLLDKQKLIEHKELSNKLPILISGNSYNYDIVEETKQEIEELGYETLMIFVNTSDEVSKLRNEQRKNVMKENVRHDKWSLSQINKENFSDLFEETFVSINNNNELTEGKHIRDLKLLVNIFMKQPIRNEMAMNWLSKRNMDELFDRAAQVDTDADAGDIELMKKKQRKEDISKFTHRDVTKANLHKLQHQMMNVTAKAKAERDRIRRSIETQRDMHRRSHRRATTENLSIEDLNFKFLNLVFTYLS